MSRNSANLLQHYLCLLGGRLFVPTLVPYTFIKSVTAFLIHHSSPFLAFHTSWKASTSQSPITYAVGDCQSPHLSLGHFIMCGPGNLAPLTVGCSGQPAVLGFLVSCMPENFGPVNDSHSLLPVADISLDSISEPRALIVHLKHSKTPFEPAVIFTWDRLTYQLLCPVATLLGYLPIWPPTPGPLFILEDGSPLSRPCLVSQLQATLQLAGIPTNGYTGHGFRIGAATAAAQAGLRNSMIQKIGRWKSAAFTIYIHPPVDKAPSSIINHSHPPV